FPRKHSALHSLVVFRTKEPSTYASILHHSLPLSCGRASKLTKFSTTNGLVEEIIKENSLTSLNALNTRKNFPSVFFVLSAVNCAFSLRYVKITRRPIHAKCSLFC